jgi:hypothetical protein
MWALLPHPALAPTRLKEITGIRSETHLPENPEDNQ